MKKITGKCHKYKEYDASPTSKRNLLFNGQLNKLNLVKFKIIKDVKKHTDIIKQNIFECIKKTIKKIINSDRIKYPPSFFW